METSVAQGNLPGPELPFLAEVGIIGPQWHLSDTQRTQKEETENGNECSRGESPQSRASISG
jgi:hypothetical protein